MKWVARERPRIGRVACAGLIARIVDVSPEFLCVPGGNVLKARRPRGCLPAGDAHHLGHPAHCEFVASFLGRVARVGAVSPTNKEPETRVNAGEGAAASFAETENLPVQRTENSPKRGCPGRRRPSQEGPNPRQHWGERAKKNQPRVVGFLNSGGAVASTIELILEGPA
jgi:hypothetical protein